METISKEAQTNEEILSLLIQDFFDSRNLPQHFIFLAHWMEKVLVNQSHKKYLSASDLLFFAEKFSTLLVACHQLQVAPSKDAIHFEESIKIPEGFIHEEQKSLAYYPYYLKRKEICNPLLVLTALFKTYPIDYYTSTLQKWTNQGLSSDNEPNTSTLIFPLYKNLKRLIEACWLIHERLVSKNSYQLLGKATPNQHFALTCPLLLSEEYLNDPYLFIESFFSFASLTEYRENLTKWFKIAINEHDDHENASDLLFLYNQFTQLIHAGYIIAQTQLHYVPKQNYTTQHPTFGHWLLSKTTHHPNLQVLSLHYRENPLHYCIDYLTPNQVIKLRYGLKEWLEAGLSKNSSITSLDYPYIFDQFEELQKILEALFLLIVQPALAN